VLSVCGDFLYVSVMICDVTCNTGNPDVCHRSRTTALNNYPDMSEWTKRHGWLLRAGASRPTLSCGFMPDCLTAQNNFGEYSLLLPMARGPVSPASLSGITNHFPTSCSISTSRLSHIIFDWACCITIRTAFQQFASKGHRHGWYHHGCYNVVLR